MKEKLKYDKNREDQGERKNTVENEYTMDHSTNTVSSQPITKYVTRAIKTNNSRSV